jgi:hypothetical protein
MNKIFNNYFEIIDSFFRSIKHYLDKKDDSHIELSERIVNYPFVSDLISDAISDIDIEIEKFWKDNIKQVIQYTIQQDSLKCLFSGDISPVILENFIKKTALYIDTVILPDPIYNLTLFHKQMKINKKEYLRLMIKHVFNIWKLKDVIFPEKRKTIILNANNNFLIYSNKIFQQDFNNVESFYNFINKITSMNAIYNKIKDSKITPNVFKQEESFNKFLTDFSKAAKLSGYNKNNSVGGQFSTYLQSQFIRVQEHKYFCNILKAEPIYDYELPWFFFNYELGGLDMDAAIANSLQKEKFNWINNVPIDAIKVFRIEDRLDYMRNILRKGITDLKAKNDQDLINTGEQLQKNLKEAFNRQKSEIVLLQKEVDNITKNQIPITSAGFLAGLIPWIGYVISFLSAGRDIKNALSRKNLIRNKIVQKKNNFINLLVKASEK